MSDRKSATFQARGGPYRVAILDDVPELDPTMLVFRGLEDVAIVTIHLNPDAKCHEIGDPLEGGHIVVSAEPLEE